jgi:hypothetical protein
MTSLAICYVKTIPKVEIVYFLMPYEEIPPRIYRERDFNFYDKFTLSDLFKTEYIHCITAKFLRETCLFCKEYLNFKTITVLWGGYNNVIIYQSRSN